MRLHRDHGLAPATVEAILDLVGEPEAFAVEDSALYRLALGVADAETRLACARALLRSPEARRRLTEIRESVRAGLGGPDTAESDHGDLWLLARFPGAFSPEDAAAVFPDRFASADVLRRLARAERLGLADEEHGERFFVPSSWREGLGAEASDATDDWKRRFVHHFAAMAASIDRLLAEGRWAEGSTRLRLSLPNLRAAWGLADETGEWEAVEGFALSLSTELMQMGEWNALADLAAAGYRASDRLEKPTLRSRLLSYEGAAASLRGDSARARALWSERVALNRRVGNPVAEADALLDLLEQALADRDAPAWSRWLREARAAVDAAGRPDLLASLHSVMARERLAAADLVRAADLAEAALATLTGALGLNVGLNVRVVAVRTLARCGRLAWALGQLADLLELAIDEGRPVNGAQVLEELAEIVEADERFVLAERCLLAALAGHRQARTRHTASVERRLDDLRGPSYGFSTVEPLLSWEDAARSVVEEIREVARDPARTR